MGSAFISITSGGVARHFGSRRCSSTDVYCRPTIAATLLLTKATSCIGSEKLRAVVQARERSIRARDAAARLLCDEERDAPARAGAELTFDKAVSEALQTVNVLPSD